VHPSFPARDYAGFIAELKKNPGKYSYSSSGTGGIGHLQMELYKSLTSALILHVPYSGAGPALNDTLAGHVQAYFSSPIAVISHIKAGKLKGVAISGRSRSVALPEVPTFAESGLPGYEAGTWAGILAHGSTPKELVNKLAAEIAAVMALPDVRESLLSQGLEPSTTSPGDFASIIKSDMARFEKVIKAANIKAEK
jgi:tripartite-type tricarboxylate transporter receptor subunit TctC